MENFFSSLFKFLFKYRPIVFQDGELTFEARAPGMFLGLGLILILGTYFLYQRHRPAKASRNRIRLLALCRSLIVVLLVFILLRPALRISTVVPGENFLAVLLDDSRSMGLTDSSETESRGTVSRGQRAFDAIAGNSDLRQRLGERMTLRYYHFAGAAVRADPNQPPRLDGGKTGLDRVLDNVRQDLQGVPLAGIVVVSDGADNSSSSLNDALLQLKSRGIPVSTVGVGQERFRRDIQLGRIEGPRRILAGTTFAVDVTVEQRGFDGETVRLTVEENGAIVETRDVLFNRGEATAQARVQLAAGEDAGPRSFRFSIPVQDGEQVAQNNARSWLLTVDKQRERILYVEAEPRYEVKFLRRALADDEDVEVVVLQQAAPNKFRRLGVESPLELATGFPSTREDLFAYRGLILGSVPADFFDANQLRMIEEFVGQRGGGLLMLGGRRSFAAGGYGGTPLGDLAPMQMPADRAETPADADVHALRITRTPDGEANAALSFATNPEESAERWSTLPALSTRHLIRRVKPGATVLLRGTVVAADSSNSENTGISQNTENDVVVLASQRYGKGKAAAFTVQDSWTWQMHADIPVEDRTHERLWRQLLRWLVHAVPDRVELDLPRNQFAAGEEIALNVAVRDRAYLALNGAQVQALVTDPLGVAHQVPLAWSVETDGEYLGTWTADEPGPYTVRVEALEGAEILGEDSANLLVGDLATEAFNAEMNGSLLRRIADDTGGRFYTLENVGGLAEDIRYTSSGKTVVESLEIWDMPIIFLTLMALLGIEWLSRRRLGLR